MVSASIYPAILILVGSLVLAFLMFYVVPRFARVYEGISGELPFFSQLLLGAGRAVQDYGALIALLIVTGIAFSAMSLSKVPGTYFGNPSWLTYTHAGVSPSYCLGTYTVTFRVVPGNTLLLSNVKEKVSPFGTSAGCLGSWV